MEPAGLTFRSASFSETGVFEDAPAFSELTGTSQAPARTITSAAASAASTTVLTLVNTRSSRRSLKSTSNASFFLFVPLSQPGEDSTVPDRQRNQRTGAVDDTMAPV